MNIVSWTIELACDNNITKNNISDSIPFSIGLDADVANYMEWLSVSEMLVFGQVNKYCTTIAEVGMIHRFAEWFGERLPNLKSVVDNLTKLQPTFKKLKKQIAFSSDSSIDCNIKTIKSMPIDELFNIVARETKRRIVPFDKLMINLLTIRLPDEITIPVRYEEIIFPYKWEDGCYLKFLEYVPYITNINLNLKGHYNRTVLHRAIETGNLKYVARLVELGADYSCKDSLIYYHATAYEEYKKDRTAARLSIIKFFFEKGLSPDSRWAVSPNDSFIHEAVRDYDIEFLNLLLEFNVLIHVINANKETPFLLACKSANRDALIPILINHYIEKKARISIYEDLKYYLTENKDDVIELILACNLNNHIKYVILYVLFSQEVINRKMIIKILDSLTDINSTADGTTLLQHASREGQLEICKLLVEYGTKLDSSASDRIAAVDIRNDKGSQALHFAAQEGQLEICKYLISCGADVNSKGVNGITPIMFAFGLYNGQTNFDVVRLLMEHGAETDIRMLMQDIK